MGVYDVETFVDNIITFLKANLNTKLTAINTEKSDTLLKSIDANAYVIQKITESAINYDPFILVAIDDIEGKGIHGAFSKNYKIIVSLIYEDEANNDTNQHKRIFRYWRALEELTNSYYNSVNRNVKILVESLTPTQIVLANKSAPSQAVGVMLTVTIV